MSVESRLRIEEIEHRVCDVVSEQLGEPRHNVFPSSRLIEDLHCDSLDLIEVIMEIEETFGVTLPNDSPYPVYKAVFTRSPFRLSDLAELVYLQQGTGTPERRGWRSTPVAPPRAIAAPFSQLEGRWTRGPDSAIRLLERLPSAGSIQQYRRRSDGMPCVMIPAATVELGSDESGGFADEVPAHTADLGRFIIDAEPVSTTAYCRFLNSIGEVTAAALADWFVLKPGDDRGPHMLIEYCGGEWRPLQNAFRSPMILVSWFGANAYSLWANGREWRNYLNDSPTSECWLPSEAQWEYAARGATRQEFPWGDEPPTQSRMRFGQHRRSLVHGQGVLPLADVNEQLGMSPFGLHHMAGNIWQWCRDWYAEDFYSRPEAARKNPLNSTPTRARSERGGSWVGPAELCRSSNRRGRPPEARGRCLGFRCITPLSELP